MPSNLLKSKIIAVDVYLDRRKSREYVGRLERQAENFIFTYHDAYRYQRHAISLGPDLPLTTQTFSSTELFVSFEDRIPSKQNPAYPEYCEMMGIDPNETNPIILLATLGRKGPSSFVFVPVMEEKPLTRQELIDFRRQLKLSVREFADLFDFSPATIHRIETNKISGKDALKRLEIYYRFPAVALAEVSKNGFKIQDGKREYVEKCLKIQEINKFRQSHRLNLNWKELRDEGKK